MSKNVKFRNHFFMVFEVLINLWWLILWGIVQIVSDKSVEETLMTIGVFTVVICVIFILSIFRWRKTTYVVTDNAFIVEKNTLFRSKNTVAMSNISTVNINRSLIQGIFGIRKVKIDINSSASAKSEIDICLKKKNAEELQNLIMDIIQGNSVNETQEIKETKETKVATFEEIFLHCIFTLKIIEIIILAISLASFMMPGATLDEGESAGGVLGFISIAIFVVGIIISMAKTFFAYHKFTAIRNADELSISYGFFDNKEFKIPVSKIVSVKIVEPLIGRLFKKAYAEIVCVGMGDEEKELSLVSLCTSKKVLAVKLHMLLPEFIPNEITNAETFYEIKKEDKRSIIVRVVSSVLLLVCFAIGIYIGIDMAGVDTKEIYPFFLGVTLALCILIILYSILKTFSSGYSVDNNYLRIIVGAFNKYTFIVPYKKIEYCIIKKSPIYKMFKLEKMIVSTKSSSMIGTLIETSYLSDEDVMIIKERFKNTYIKRAH